MPLYASQAQYLPLTPARVQKWLLADVKYSSDEREQEALKWLRPIDMWWAGEAYVRTKNDQW